MNPARLQMALLLCACIVLSQSAGALLPLRDQWQAAVRAVQRGDAAMAIALMEEFQEWYGTEEVTRDPEFREPWLRLRGLVSLQTGASAQGASLLESWLDEFPHKKEFRAYVRFQLANARLSEGDTEGAVSHWRAFLAEHAELPEVALVHWLWADLEISRSRPAQARGHLQQVLAEERLPAGGRALAAAALSLVELSEGDAAAAFARLEAAPEMDVLRLWRAILAPAMVQQLIESDQSEMAVAASGWFFPPNHLRQQADSLRVNRKRSHARVRQLVWASHWNNKLNQLTNPSTLEGAAAHGLGKLYQLRLRALAEAGQSIQGSILAETLLASNHPDLVVFRAGFYASAIEASQLLGDWQRAGELAEAFMKAYPGDPGLPEILFLQAQTAAGRKDGTAAIQLASRLIEEFPEHSSAGAWRVTTAGWKLEFGHPEEALTDYRTIIETCPEPWLPVLHYQVARCQEQLRHPDSARATYEHILGHYRESPTAEQACLALLKLHLGSFDERAFQETLNLHHRHYPEGRTRPYADLLEASFHVLANRVEPAIRLYQDLSTEEDPVAFEASRELSGAHRSLAPWKELKTHALGWIQRSRSAGNSPPEEPFKDCLAWQQAQQAPALPDALVASLLEDLDQGRPAAPPGCVFEVIGHQWPLYRLSLVGEAVPLENWINDKARTHQMAGRFREFSMYSLEAARLLEAIGRIDSADSRRIEVLTHVDPGLLNAEGKYQLAMVAAKYDFPQAEVYLEDFLSDHPDSPNGADVRYALAGRLDRVGERQRAASLLEEVRTQWPDAAIFREALLLLAGWQLEEGSLGPAGLTLDSLLERDDLGPRHTAQALLLRARLDAASGHPERCRVNCQRILTLYPVLEDICAQARQLLEEGEHA